MVDKDGNTIIYAEDNKTVFMIEDKDQNRTYFRDDGVTRLSTSYKNGYDVYYDDLGLKPVMAEDNKGNTVYYGDDGKTINAVKDKNENMTYFKADGVTVSAVQDSNGNKTFYEANGKDIKGARDNEQNLISYTRTDGKTVVSIENSRGKSFPTVEAEIKCKIRFDEIVAKAEGFKANAENCVKQLNANMQSRDTLGIDKNSMRADFHVAHDLAERRVSQNAVAVKNQSYQTDETTNVANKNNQLSSKMTSAIMRMSQNSMG